MPVIVENCFFLHIYDSLAEKLNVFSWKYVTINL